MVHGYEIAIQDGGGRHFKIKFDTDTENKVPKPILNSELVSNKIQDGGGRHIENHIFGHNSAIIERMCTKFET